MKHLSKAQRDRLIGTLLSILASVVFAVAESIMSDDEEDPKTQETEDEYEEIKEDYV